MARRKKQNEDLPQENLDSGDDSFGLPEIDYEPLKREPQSEEVVNEVVNEPPAETSFPPVEPLSELPPDDEQPKEEFVEENQFYEPSYSYSYEDERPPIWPKVLGIILVLALAGGAVWYFAKYRPEQQAIESKLNRERLAAQEKQRKIDEARLAEERLAEEKNKAATPAVVEKPAGTIETLTSRSGRYYVVAASSIDGDLIMDYAQKLSKKGVTSTIIPPYGKVQFHRLAIADGDTYENAQATADGMKGGEYGDKLWVVKY